MARAAYAMALVLLSVGGCGRASEPRGRTTDGAGVQIVTNARLDGAEETLEPLWKASSATWSNLTALAPFGDGVIVANSGDGRLVALDSTGRAVWTFGRRGEGPGEFRGDLSLAVTRSVVSVYDFVTRRLVRIDSSGALLGTAVLPATDPNLELMGAVDDSTLLFTARHLAGRPGLVADSTVVVAYSGEGLRRGPIASVPGRRVFFLMDGGPPIIDDQPFAPNGLAAVAGARLLIAAGADSSLRVVNAEGATLRVVRWSGASRPVTPSEVAAFKSEYLASRRQAWQRAPAEAWVAKVPIPARHPPAVALVGLPDGAAVVGEGCPADQVGCRFLAFDSAGLLRRAFRLPAGVRTVAGSAERLYAIATEADGSEIVLAFRRPIRASR